MMNENQSIIKNYILIIKTFYGNTDDHISVVIKGINGQTEKILLKKSQSHDKAFQENQTDLFVIRSNIDVGKIVQVEFYAKLKEWKFQHIFIINGTYVYRDNDSEYSLTSSMNIPCVVDMVEPCIESQESIYYALVKTGTNPCSKDSYPKLSLFDNDRHHTEIDMKSSINNNLVLQKNQLDIFQWQDTRIENIERMCLQLYSEDKQLKCQWSIEWLFVIHHGYAFTGRIMLNRNMTIDRVIDMNFEQKILSIPNEYGDSLSIEQKHENNILPFNISNKQTNATTDEIGRYYVLLRNMEGTTGNVYIQYHGDRLSSSDEQQLSKSENYAENPFSSKHTDLFHTKALEVGDIHSVSIRLDQTEKENSITLDKLYIIHNAKVYYFDLKYIILNKEQPNKEFFPLSHTKLNDEKICYYIATHTADQMLSRTNAKFKIVVTGKKGMFGPIELKESLTNENNPFERECIDLFHFEDVDIGDPISATITVEPKGIMPHLFSSAKCDRIMLVKESEYNSLWQVVGDLKAKEPKTVHFPINQRQSFKNTVPDTSVKTSLPRTTNEISPLDINQLQSLKDTFPGTPEKTTPPTATDEISPLDINQLQSLKNTFPGTPEKVISPRTTDEIPPADINQQISSRKLKFEESIEREPVIKNLTNFPSGDYHQYDNLTMTAIEDHQKRHTFAPTLYQAQQNYRELRRLLRKMNRTKAKDDKTDTTQKQ